MRSTCLSGERPPTLIRDYQPNRNGERENACLPGYVCPFLDPDNDITWPTSCFPTPQCVTERLSTLFCEPQGFFEPYLCPAGFFCPNSQNFFPCPKGHFCTVGTVVPLRCSFLSICREGSRSDKYYGSLVILAVSHIIFLSFFYFQRRAETKRLIAVQKRKREKEREIISRRRSISSYHANLMLLTPSPYMIEKQCIEDRDRGEVTVHIYSHHETAMTDLIELDGGDRSRETERERDIEMSLTRTLSFNELFVGQHMIDSTANAQTRLLVEAYKRANKGVMNLDVKFHSLSLWLPPKLASKQILTGASGRFLSSKITAVMGPSGSGKTSLFSAILGNIGNGCHREGVITVNGKERDLSGFRYLIGYVPQDDIMRTELTVQANVYHCGRTRLPSSWSNREVERQVEVTLEALDILHIKDCVVGDTMTRGVSGGERKRVNIAMELVSLPCILFMDEPTSGLDSFTALELMSSLDSISRRTGMSVVVILHQPRCEIWERIDELLLLATGGRVVYGGERERVREYFKEVCLISMKDGDNPADVFIDTMASSQEELVMVWKRRGRRWVESEREKERMREEERERDDPTTMFDEEDEEEKETSLSADTSTSDGISKRERRRPILSESETERERERDSESYIEKEKGKEREREREIHLSPSPTRQPASVGVQFILCFIRSFRSQWALVNGFMIEMVLSM